MGNTWKQVEGTLLPPQWCTNEPDNKLLLKSRSMAYWETSRKQTKIQSSLKHPHYSVLWDSRRQEGNKCSFLQPRAPTTFLETVGDKGETSVGSCGTEHPKYPWRQSGKSAEHPLHTGRQSETSGRQAGHKCRINCAAKNTHNTLADTGGPSWRQVGGKRRTMQLRASTAYWETLVDKWEASAAQSIQRAFADGKQLGAKLERGRQVCNQPDLQDKW